MIGNGIEWGRGGIISNFGHFLSFPFPRTHLNAKTSNHAEVIEPPP